MRVFAVDPELHVADRTVAHAHLAGPPGGGAALAEEVIELERPFLSLVGIETEPGMPAAGMIPETVTACLAVIVVGKIHDESQPAVPVIDELHLVVEIPAPTDIGLVAVPGPINIDVVPRVAKDPPVIGGPVLQPAPALSVVITPQIAQPVDLQIPVHPVHPQGPADMLAGAPLDAQIGSEPGVLVVHPAEDRLPLKAPVAVGRAQPPIDAPRGGRMFGVLGGQGHHRADVRLGQHILLEPQNGIGGRRLDHAFSEGGIPLRGLHRVTGLLLLGDRAQQRHLGAAGQFAGQLGCPQDGRRLGVAGVIQRILDRVAPGGTADPAGVKQLVFGVEQLHALHKEGPPLLIPGLVGRQVEHRLVQLHLAEVGIHRGVQGEIGGQPVFQVEAQVLGPVPAVRISSPGGLGLQAGDGIGQKLHVRGRLDAGQPGEMPEVGDVAALRGGHEGPADILGLAVDAPNELDTPGAVAVLGEADAVIGNLHLGRPAPGLRLHRRAPHPVPAVLHPVLVEQPGILLDIGGVDPEAVAGLVVMIGIQVDPDEVGLRGTVPADQLPGDLVRIGIITPEGEIDGGVIINNGHASGLGGRLSLIRLPLGKVSSILQVRLSPGRIAKVPVDDRRGAVHPAGPQLGNGPLVLGRDLTEGDQQISRRKKRE